MWKPDENLDDYVVTPDPDADPKPPLAVSLRRTGELEVLKPLTRLEAHEKRIRTAFKAFRPLVVPQPLWFRRFLAVGSGGLVMIALILVSAILVGINDPAAGPDVASTVQPSDEPIQPEEPISLDVSSPLSFAPAVVGSEIVLPTPKTRAVRPRIEVIPYRPRRYARPLP